MKLSFSLPSRVSSKPIQNKTAEIFEENFEIDEEIKREYFTEFDPSNTLNGSEKFVIPPIPNEWDPRRKQRTGVRSSADDLGVGFKVEAPSTAGVPDSNTSFGLNLRQDKEANTSQYAKEKMEIDSLVRSGHGEELSLERLKEDIKNLPQDRGLDEFVDVPVEGFGEALLAGYGWHKGMGIGRNAKEDVKVYEFTRRTGMAGLGFVEDFSSQNVLPNGPDDLIERLQAQVDNMLSPRKPMTQEWKEDRISKDDEMGREE